jgi:2'-hydroxyisoflavone reductase
VRLLVLGGTAFLGTAVALDAVAHGHDVTCLARGQSGAVPEGARWVRSDRDDPTAGLGGAEDRTWDAVVDVARDPGQVRRAAAALAGRTEHAVFVSTGNVYADHSVPGADETTPLLAPRDEGGEDPDAYGAAKVACEDAYREAFGARRVLVARAGLIGGPGDASGRTGYWPWRFAHPAVPGEVLVPDDLASPAQLVDVRDLAAWIVRCAAQQVPGTVDAVGPPTTFGAVVAAAEGVGGSGASPVATDPEWLVGQGVQPWMGPTSLPLWLPVPEYAGFAARTGAAARRLGLTTRPLAETLRDALAWEEHGRPEDRPRRAGLTDAEERGLLRAWHRRPPQRV